MLILLIVGGWSAEREVALNGGKALHKSMERLGHTVRLYDPATSLDGLHEATKGVDFAFINLHGEPGEDGIVQAMLEQMRVPYQGSGPAGSMLALDKSVAKSFFAAAGMHVAPSVLLTQKPHKGWRPEFSLPAFVKATTGGSTLNMEYVAGPEALDPALDRLFARGGAYLVEQAVIGLEVTCGVLGEIRGSTEEPVALPPILIKANKGAFFDYESKYSQGGAEEICPAPLLPAVTERVQKMSVLAHRLLGLSGYSRSDFILPADEEPVILEVNTLPGLTETSLIPKEVDAIGLGFDGLVDRLITLGLHRAAQQSLRYPGL